MVYPTRASHFAKSHSKSFSTSERHAHGERERERERERHGVMGVKFNNLAFGGRVSTHNHDGSLF